MTSLFLRSRDLKKECEMRIGDGKCDVHVDAVMAPAGDSEPLKLS